MGSVNAFAGSIEGLETNGIREHEDTGRPHKRARLSDNDGVAAIQTQCVPTDTALEVDHMILDYTAYKTIEACFASRRSEPQSGSARSLANSLTMSDSFLSIFKARHSTYRPDPELRLRILLLKLTTLFTQRMTSNPTTPAQPALQELRQSNEQRAQYWQHNVWHCPSSSFDTDSFRNNLPISQQELERNRAHVLHELGIPAEDEDYEDAFYGTSSCISLLDIMPLFMKVSAARNAMSGSNLTERWMQLACDFMLQACLEQFLVFGAQGSDAIDEAFAWGYVEDGHGHINGIEEGEPAMSNRDEVDAMFEDDEYAMEVEGWSETKASYLNQLFPSVAGGTRSIDSDPATAKDDTVTSEDVVSHLETLAARFPIATFEASLLGFLEALSKSIPDPVLIQLEAGKLDGMTARETEEFLVECGVSTANVY